MKQKSLQQLQKQVDAFNLKHPVGTKCLISLDSGEKKPVTVESAAAIIGGHSAVGWFEEISGCYSLDRVVNIIKS